MLFSCLQGHAQCAVALSIHAYADDTAGDASFKIIFCSKECGMWATESERDAKALGRANGNISAKFARRCQQCECKKICCHCNQCSGSVYIADELPVIFNGTLVIRVLNDCAEV